MAQTTTRLQHVAIHEVGRVLNAVLLLHVGTRGSDHTTVNNGVTTRRRHLVDEHNVALLGTEVVRFKRSSATSKTRTDNQETGRFISLLRHFARECRGGNRGSSGSGTKEGAAA